MQRKLLRYSPKFDRPLQSETDGSDGLQTTYPNSSCNAGSAISHHNLPVSKNSAESSNQTLGT